MDLLDWILAPLQPLVGRPDRIAGVCALLLAVFVLVLLVRRFPPWPLLVASGAWGAFAVWEAYAKAKGWNIRVDLFLIYPVMIILTAWGVFSIVRKRRTHERPRLIAVCLRDPNGMSAETRSQLEGVIASAAPEWTSFLAPHSFVVFFAADEDGAARARRLVNEVFALNKTDTAFAGIRIGRSEGHASVSRGPDGKLNNPPLGGFVNEALDKAAI